ncbi:APH(3') family aminoglycoside O-phosphotransferase [Bacillus testis]|uniref:APH(3') family aminoglycoside O-phosphotransferase n=1 Tax=Bacillus testis TaxID=1622072 RepID=UPI00067F04E6|nr:APH(3') family aminoglycoside O-phosphotransferase [Bacillus testis]
MKQKKKSLPDKLQCILKNHQLEAVKIGRSPAEVYKCINQKDDSIWYLKELVKPAVQEESLRVEKEKLEWFRGKITVPEVVCYDEFSGKEYLLTTGLGPNNLAEGRLDTAIVIDQFAALLRAIHQLPVSACPFKETLDVKKGHIQKRLAAALVDSNDFEQEFAGMEPQALFELWQHKTPDDEDLVVVHGDYTLKNVIGYNGVVAGMIDCGRSGVGDRYQDLAIAFRDISKRASKEAAYYFLDCYGQWSVDEEKLSFYIMMDEFF